MSPVLHPSRHRAVLRPVTSQSSPQQQGGVPPGPADARLDHGTWFEQWSCVGASMAWLFGLSTHTPASLPLEEPVPGGHCSLRVGP